MANKVVKLIMVTENNNNKFYNLIEKGDGTFLAEWGRVDVTKSEKIYPMSKWDSTYRSKTRKGYKDVTEMYAVVSTNNTTNSGDSNFISDDTFVQKLIEDLQRYANKTVTTNYKVSSKKVTQKMIDEAQIIIDKIATTYKRKYSNEELNKLLIELFTIIPRKMSKVNHFLVSDDDTKKDISKIIDNEQSLLDTMAGQVLIQDNDTDEEDNNKDKTDKKHSVLDSMGITCKHVTDEATIRKVKKLMGGSAHQFSRLFKVENKKTSKAYKSIPAKNEELFFHGSRNENFFNILQTGLLIRPSGAIHTGSMFGDSLYFASKAQKSIGYTSLRGSYWASGSSNKGYLALFAVNLGNIKHVYKHTPECYKFSEKTISPKNSVHAHGGIDLRNDEFMVYNSNRCTIKYFVEITN